MIKVKPLAENLDRCWCCEETDKLCIPLGYGYYTKIKAGEPGAMVWFYNEPVGYHSTRKGAVDLASKHNERKILRQIAV